MAFKVLYHEEALAELEALLDWSQTNHPETSEEFANGLLNHVDLLATLPYIGVAVEHHSGIRRLLHSPFYVYYFVDEVRGAIEILHFWHAARRTPEL